MQRRRSFWSSLGLALGLLSPLKRQAEKRRRQRDSQSLRRLRNSPLALEQLEAREMLTTVSIFATASGSEAGGAIGLQIYLNQPDYQNNVLVDWATAGNSATSGSDYTAASGTATITAGSMYTTVYVSPINDTLDEDTESLYVNLSNPVNATISLGQSTISLGDDDNPPTVNVADASAAEGSALNFTLTLSAASGKTISVGYYTASGSASSSSDYTQVTSGSVIFNPGETSKTATVSTTGDSNKESDETLNVTLTTFSNVMAGDTSAVGTILDNDRTGRTNADGDLTGENYAAHAGGVKEEIFVFPDGVSSGGGVSLVYDSLSAGRQIVAIETVQPNDGSTPTKIKAELTFGGVTGDTKWFNGSNLAPGSTQRFVLSANCSGLATGRYEYTVKLTEYFTSGQTTSRTFTGWQTVVNRNSSEYGANWWLSGLDRLHVHDDGVLWVRGDNIAAWYEEDGSGGYDRPPGYFEDLAHASGTYTLTHHGGGTLEFNSSGLLTKRQDTNGNAWEYAYSSGKLASITDPTGRATTFTYTSGKLSSVTDPYARSTSFSYTSSKLTGCVLPDPDAGGPLSSPDWEFTYDTTTGLLEDVIDPRAKTTTFTYDSLYRVSEVTDPLDYTRGYFPAVTCGYPTSGGTEFSPATLPDDNDDRAHVVDSLSNDIYINVNDRGQTTQLTNQLGHVWTYVRNADGQITQLTGPDPDGGGPRSAPVWEFSYDAGDLVGETLPDEEERAWEYHEQFHVVTRSDDELGRITLYEIDDETGNTLSVTRVVGQIDDEINQETDDVTLAAYTYTPAPASAGDLPGGLLLTVTDALGRVTEYEWQDDFQSLDFGRLLSVTRAAGTADEAAWTYGYDAYGNVDTLTDPLGRTTVYEYDRLNRLIELTQPDPDAGGPLSSPVWTWEYDAAGNVIAATDALGATTEFTYDDLNRLILAEKELVDSPYGPYLSQIDEWEYNAAGWVTLHSDSYGRETVFEYNDVGWMTEVTLPDPDGAGGQSAPAYSFTFDALGNVLTETDPLGNVTSHEYDERSRRVETTLPDPDGGGGLAAPVYSWTFDAAGQLLSATDPLANVTSYDWDVFGRLIELTLPDPDGGGGQSAPVYEYGYDLVGNRTSETDALGNTTDYTFDNLNRVVEIELADPDGGGGQSRPVYTFEYDAASQLIAEIDPLGAETTREYDNLGRLITLTLPDPDGAGGLAAPEYTYTYDALSQLLTSTDARGGVTAREYNFWNQLVEVTLPDPDGGGGLASPVLEFRYDLENRLLEETDALGNETTHEYDNLDRRISTTLPDPDGGGGLAAPEYSWTFDAVGNVLSETDALGKTTNHAYDNLYRLIETELPDPDGAGALGRPTTAYSYDAAGNLLTLTDPVGNVTTWDYDNLHRVIEELNELGDSRFFEYDAMSNLVERTDRNGRVIEFDYDNLYRLTTETWKDGASTVNTLNFSYDAASRLLAASDDFSDYTFTRDALGRVIETEVDNGGPQVRLFQSWDGDSNRTLLSAQIDVGSGYVNDFENVYTFDALSRMTRIDQDERSTGGSAVADKRIDLAYNANGLLASITRYSSLAGGSGNRTVETTYTRDNLSRVTDIIHADGGTTFADYAWTYDAGSRVTSFDSALFNAEDATYSYDHTGQLTGADRSGSSNDEAFAFDENGNRTMSGYVGADNNRLMSDGTYDYDYDDEGNMIRQELISTGAYMELNYDHNNHLTKITWKTSGGTVTKWAEYTYDVFGRRIVKLIDADGAGGGGALGSEYILDSAGKLDPATGMPLDDIILAFAKGGSEDGALTNRYLHGPLVDQVLAEEGFDPTAADELPSSDGDVLWPLGDNLGTIRDLVDSSSNVVNHLVFSSWGEITSETDPSVDHIYGFTGREHDEESPFQYNRDRYLHNSTGRWTSEDREGFGAGDTNLSRAVGNGPTNYTDPSGRHYPADSERAGFDEWLKDHPIERADVLLPADYQRYVDQRWAEYQEELQAQREQEEAIRRAIDEAIAAELKRREQLDFQNSGPQLHAMSEEEWQASCEYQEYLHKLATNPLFARTEYWNSIGAGPLYRMFDGFFNPTYSGMCNMNDILPVLAAGSGKGLQNSFTGLTPVQQMAAMRARNGRGGRSTALSGRPAEDAVSRFTGVPLNRGTGRDTVLGSGPGGIRIPDLQMLGRMGSIVLRGSIVEVKSGGRVYWSGQLRDFVNYASRNGLKVELFTNAPIPKSGKLYDAIKAGDVIVAPIP